MFVRCPCPSVGCGDPKLIQNEYPFRIKALLRVFDKSWIFSRILVPKCFITLGYTLRITEKLYREENESKFTRFGAVKNIGFAVIFKKFQKISRFFEIGDLPFYLAPLPDIFERKDPGFVRFTGRSDDPENLSKKY